MKKLLSAISVVAIALSVMGQGVAIAATPTVPYIYKNVEESIEAIPDSALTFKNNSRSGVTATGMTKTSVYDEEKGKDVMQLAFKNKVESSGKSIDVLASLDGLADLLTDNSSNTISFEYKVTGTSTGNIAMFFVGEAATDFSETSTKYPAIGIRSNGGIAAFARPNANRGAWYSYVGDSWVSHDSDNTQWNRLTIVVDSNGTKITDIYINGEVATFKNSNGWGLITDGTVVKGEIDKILFNTEGEVSAEKDLAILLDNIKVYPGEIDFTGEKAFMGTWNFENGLEMKNFGLSDSDGVMISDVQSDVCVKTKLCNLSENPMKLLVFISGYNDGALESVDFKMCDLEAGAEIDIDNINNTLSLDNEQEYDRIQLSIVDGESGYPLIESRELIKE